MSPCIESLRLFDHVARRLETAAVAAGMDQLLQELNHIRCSSSSTLWASVGEAFDRHSIRRLVHQAPFTRSAYEKPRGYAGDAGTLDFIYGATPLPAGTSELGREIYAWEFGTASCQSVRARRDILAQKIDEAAAQRSAAKIVAIACGHCRELALSSAVRQGTLGEFIALDQDEESLNLVRAEYGEAVTTVPGTVNAILASRFSASDADLIYAAGLYDYLSDPGARRLTRQLFSMLRLDGGRLLLANFAPNLPDIGYMETCMRWPLHYRDEAQLQSLSDGIPSSQIAEQSLFRDDHGNVVFLELVHA